MKRKSDRRSARLLRGFDRAAKRMRTYLVHRYGPEVASTLVATAREEYARLIPELPDLRGRQPFTQFVITTAWSLAFYRVLAKRGEPAREAGELAYALTAEYLSSVPPIGARLIQLAWFSRLFRNRVRHRARQSQKRKGTGDFVYEYVEGDGDPFDFGVDYSECAVLTFLRSQDATDLAPYICALDQLSGDAFGWGLERTMTLAEGGSRCDFRFKRGRPTKLTSTVLPLLDPGPSTRPGAGNGDVGREEDGGT